MIEKTFQIKPVALPDNLDSCWFHPDIKEHDTIEDGVEYYTKEQWEQLKKNLGVEIIYDRWDYEPYRVCRRLNILRDYSDEKTKLYPRN